MAAMLLLFAFSVHKSPRRRGPRIPSGGRVEVLWRGAFGMDAKRGMPGHGWPVLPTLGPAPERGELSAAKPGCRARFLFGYFLFRASKEKVTRRKAETSKESQYTCGGMPTVNLRKPEQSSFYRPPLRDALCESSKQRRSTSRRFTATVAFARQLCRGEASAGAVIRLNYPLQAPIERITGQLEGDVP